MILQLDFGGGGLSVLEVCFRAVLKGRTGIALGCRLGKLPRPNGWVLWVDSLNSVGHSFIDCRFGIKVLDCRFELLNMRSYLECVLELEVFERSWSERCHLRLSSYLY